MELPGPLVSADWLADHLDDVAVVDVRWAIDTGPQRTKYLAGHIPGAVFADLDADLSAPAGPSGRHPLPTPADFAEARGRLGLHAPVVAYDQGPGAIAARLWWMLDSIGVDAAVLDGGIEAWSGDLESGERQPQADEAPLAIEWPDDRYIEADGIHAAIHAGHVLIDARTTERFRGDSNPIDATPGHIPGAKSRPWQSNMAGPKMAPGEDLAAQFATQGIDDATALVSTCGSGVTACHNLLAARLAGIADARLYVGSWSEWSQSDRPIATGQ